MQLFPQIPASIFEFFWKAKVVIQNWLNRSLLTNICPFLWCSTTFRSVCPKSSFGGRIGRNSRSRLSSHMHLGPGWKEMFSAWSSIGSHCVPIPATCSKSKHSPCRCSMMCWVNSECRRGVLSQPTKMTRTLRIQKIGVFYSSRSAKSD